MNEQELKKIFPDADHYRLAHAIRLNGVVDVWRNMKTVYCIPANEYRNIPDKQDRILYIYDCLQKYEKREPMKKLPTGRMSMQEFRNNKHQH